MKPVQNMWHRNCRSKCMIPKRRQICRRGKFQHKMYERDCIRFRSLSTVSLVDHNKICMEKRTYYI